ncbi:MAG: zinc transporter ZupT [Candidatus Lokiarchaeia archaeon]|nr:zinc transporter ZupT [Candidatus Lokiarchaeia archaeon]
MEAYLFALILTSIAGLSTTVGSFIAIIVKEPSKKFISFIMGFSAGVMILISFVELLQQGIETLGFLLGNIFFLIGMFLMLIIDISISHKYEFEDGKGKFTMNLQKTSLLVTLGIFIHNFPEGMVTFVAAIKNVDLGIILCFAIALHNVPEGIAVAVPIYTSTKNRKKAFIWSFISGVSEPLGALIVGFILFPFINDYILSIMLAGVGGFMVYISLDELLPASRDCGFEHLSIIGIIIGMIVMVISLGLL